MNISLEVQRKFRKVVSGRLSKTFSFFFGGMGAGRDKIVYL